MNYETLVGDIVQFPGDVVVIAHGCNTKNCMGNGLAKQVRLQIPEAFKADTKAHKKRKNCAGSFSFCYVDKEETKRVYNLYQQEHFGVLNFLALKKSLINMLKHLRSTGASHTKVGLPWKLGCGKANGNWNKVLPMILEVFDDFNNPLTFIQLYEEDNNEKEDYTKEASPEEEIDFSEKGPGACPRPLRPRAEEEGCQKETGDTEKSAPEKANDEQP